MVFGCSYECLNAYYRHGKRALGFTVKCGGCGEMKRKMPKCSLCKLTRYCSPVCQKADWKEHKKGCKEICKDKAKEKRAGV
jgi:hypothetical protein